MQLGMAWGVGRVPTVQQGGFTWRNAVCKKWGPRGGGEGGKEQCVAKGHAPMQCGLGGGGAAVHRNSKVGQLCFKDLNVFQMQALGSSGYKNNFNLVLPLKKNYLG